MATTILQILALLGFLVLPLVKWPKNRLLKYKRPDRATISSKYVVNSDGEIEELLSKEQKKEDF